MAGILLLLSVRETRAQSATGDMHGVVVEQAAGPLARVGIAVVNLSTGMERHTSTTPDGLFTVAGLPAGTYEITARLAGFAEQRLETVELRLGESLPIRLELRKAPLAETISLAAPPPAFEPLRSSAASAVPEREMAHLPLFTRDSFDFLYRTPLITGDADDGPWAALGLPATLNGFAVDGANNRNAFSGLSFARRRAPGTPYQFGEHVLQEIRVNVGTATAENGNGAAALVTALTRSGSARFTGDLFERYRDTALTAPTPADEQLGRDHASTHAHQFGGTLAGPLFGPRQTFFAAYDGLRGRDDNIVIPNLPGTLDPASQVGAARLQASSAPWRQTRLQDVWLIRTDHAIGSGHRLSVRYNDLDLRGEGLEQSGERVSQESSGRSLVQTQSVVASLGTSAGSFMNDLRVQYARDRDLGTTNSTAPQADVREGATLVLRVGGDATNPHDTTLRQWQLADTLSWVLGRHTFKTGADIQANDVEHSFATNVAGAYVFDSLSRFGIGVPNGAGGSFTQTFVPGGGSSYMTTPDSRDYAAFFQDTWRVGDTLTVDAGLRYDVQTIAATSVLAPPTSTIDLPATSPRTDTNNWAPRLGIAWAPQRYVVRAAYGITYASTPTTWAAAAQAYGRGLQTITLDSGSGSALPTYPAILPAMPAPTAGGRPFVVGFSSEFDQPRVQHATAGFEWEWMPHTSLAFTYLHADGRDLPRAVERNTGGSVPVTLVDAGTGDTFTYLRVGPGPATTLSRIIELESTGSSRYDGVVIELRRALWQGMHYRLAYALGKSTDNGILTAVVPETDADRQVMVAGAPERDQDSPADNDRRHRFTADVVYFTDGFASRQQGALSTLLDHWRVAASYTIATGLPYTAYVASDANGDRNRFNDIAPGTSRNQFRREKEGRLDARVARVIPAGGLTFTLSLDAFNIFNAAHDRDVDDLLFAIAGNTLFRNGEFGTSFTSTTPRTLQLGLGISF